MNFDINEDYRVKWYPKQHVTAADLADARGGYRTVEVKIKAIRVEKLMKQKTNKREDTPIAIFEKGSKYLILSNAVCKGLHEATGTAIPKEWIGKPIELYVEKGVKAFGKVTDQVRVRKVNARSRAAAAAPQGDWSSEPAPEMSPLSPEEQEAIESFQLNLDEEPFGDDDHDIVDDDVLLDDPESDEEEQTNADSEEKTA